MKNYLIKNKELMKEWDWNKNKELDPNLITCGSKVKAWWICTKGHSFFARVDSRYIGTSCPYCINRKVLKGFNDLETTNPELLKEWDYERNKTKPDEVTYGSSQKIWWKCSENHNYEMSVRNRYMGYTCPICSYRNIISGVNDFASFDKRLTSEWNYEKNINLDPTKISPNYDKKVWWIGACGHEWEASVYSRTKMGTNCPVCAEERHASVSEKSVLYYLKKSNKFKNTQENYKDENIKLELDIYIPEIKTAIEYDGERWHRNVKKDLKKDQMCFDNDIKLIRIREKGCPDYSSKSVKINLPTNKIIGLEQAINELLKYFEITNVDVDIERDTTDILSMINFMVKENSLSILYPELACEWHPTKNGNLKPEHTKPNSNKKVWWLCPNGHEYQLEVYQRTTRGNGCTICSSHKILKGFNDLGSNYPELVCEWHPTKNGNLTPYEVSTKSHKKVWWICIRGHEWQATIGKRSNGRGCPYCAGRKVLRGYNDLATINPKLSQEWNYKKNGELKPTELSSHSGRKVWWKCSKCGHEWEATVDHRSRGRGCLICSREKKNIINKLDK